MPHGAWLHGKVAPGCDVQHETNLRASCPTRRSCARSIGDEATRQHEFPDTDRLFLEIDAPWKPHGGDREGARPPRPRGVRQNPLRGALKKASRFGTRRTRRERVKRKSFSRRVSPGPRGSFIFSAQYRPCDERERQPSSFRLASPDLTYPPGCPGIDGGENLDDVRDWIRNS